MIVKDSLIEPFIKSFKAKNKTIVLVGGCFDVLHDGHFKFLKETRRLGDVVILLLESDENIKKIKGEDRPVNNLVKRADALESLGLIDFIVILKANVSDKYYYNLTKLIQPDIIAITKGDPLTDLKQNQAESVGGKVVEVIERDENFSTTKLINKK